jgi:hypothetical protein
VFANKVLRRIFGPKRDEVTVGWRNLRKEEVRYLYSSPSIIRIIHPRVEAENTSTVVLRILRGDIKGTKSQMRQ